MDINKVKNRGLLISSVLAVVFGYLYFANPKIVTKTEIDTKMVQYWQGEFQKMEMKYTLETQKHTKTVSVTHIEYRTDGTVASSTSSSSIQDDSHSTATATATNTVTITNSGKESETKKEIIRYSENSLWITGEGMGIIKDFAPGIEAKIDNYEFGISYAIIRQEWNARAGIKVVILPF